MDFVGFIYDYWEIILSTLLVIIQTIVIIVIKKKQGVSPLEVIKAQLLEKLPLLISSVECNGNGAEKKNRVLAECLKSAASSLGRALNDDEISMITVYIGEQIENILKTPTKKQTTVKGDKKNVYRAS